MSCLTHKSQNNKTGDHVTDRQFETEDSVQKRLIKKVELPSFIDVNIYKISVPKSNGKGRYQKKVTDFVCHCNHCNENKIEPVFNDLESVQRHVLEHSRENRGLSWFICHHCVDKGFETHVPTTPGCIYEHMVRYHKNELKQLGLSLNKFGKILYCHDCKEYTTYQHKHCFKCPNHSGNGFMSFQSKHELNCHLKSCHPIEKPVCLGKVSVRKPHERKRVIDLRDEDGNETDAI